MAKLPPPEGYTALESFVRAASHDLQSPARKISALAALIHKKLDADPDPDTARALAFLMEAADQQHSLIGAVLSHLTLATRPLALESLALDDIVHGVVGDLEAQITQTRAELVLAPLPPVQGDRALLTAVITELIGNALLYSGPQRPRIAVSATKTKEAIELVINDTGIGIAPEYLEQVLDPFARLHSADLYPGHGLGLASCQIALARLGGAMTLASTPGAGTRVTLHLPRPDREHETSR